MTRVAVVTVVSGRHRHLRAQRAGLAQATSPPAVHVVVAMGDPTVGAVLDENPVPTTLVTVGTDDHRLPLATARNRGAATAIDAGAELLVFLDVDCIPTPDLLARYASAAAGHPDTLLCGPVTYLPPRESPWTTAELSAATDPHPARPNPPDGVVVVGDDPDLFWSLSFAVTPQTWRRVGGFCEDYRGYGGEDTDFAAVAAVAGIGISWVGGAHAHHQHHPVSRPPVEHLDDIVVNATVFHRRWGRWPMTGWLDDFERAGLITRSAQEIVVRN
ncbi:sugar transferase [Williamsia sp. Leaf354]|uniref:glycosyltransferase family 2 protein n=1 Tax=Williamsia sp. Leaf354 TaxID=1736349 RepID=UPI0006FD2ACE|nr:galactosyltransferase-related protein [Williamsia sp. Leaf354]KQS00256.1 sugar transferase [Williamsia sp. Leaf354]